MLGKLSDKDYRFGPITIGICEKRQRTSFSYFHLESGHYQEEDGPTSKMEKFYTTLTCKFGKLFSIRILLPTIIKPAVWKVKAPSWSKETIERLGRDWYYEYRNKCYGFSVDTDYINFKWGLMVNDCGMIVSRDKFLDFPWKTPTYIQAEYYDQFGNVQQISSGNHFQNKDELEMTYALIKDYDETVVKASFMKVVRVYYRFSGKLLWLAKLLPKKRYTSLEINFDQETGPKKGSWKGGTIGSSSPADPDKTALESFKIYCEKHGFTFMALCGFGKGPIPYKPVVDQKENQDVMSVVAAQDREAQRAVPNPSIDRN